MSSHGGGADVFFWDYGAFAAFGVMVGVLGGCFNELNRALSIWRNKMDFGWESKAFIVHNYISSLFGLSGRELSGKSG